MSERYGNCHLCLGHGSIKNPAEIQVVIECPRCDGTGFSADVYDLLDPSSLYRIRKPQDPEERARGCAAAVAEIERTK